MPDGSGENDLSSGPAHWRATYIRFAERCDAAEVFTEDDADMQRQNGLRQIELLRMMSACEKQSHLRPPVPKRHVADEEPSVADRLASVTLCAFSARHVQGTQRNGPRLWPRI